MLPLPSPWRHLPPPVVSAKRLRRTFSRRYPTFPASRFHLALFTGKRQTDRGDLRQGGKRASSIRVSIGDTRELTTRAARAIAKEYLAQISRGQHPKTAKQDGETGAGQAGNEAKIEVSTVTLRQAWQRYREAHLIRKGRSEKTISGYRDQVEGLFAEWLDTSLSELAMDPARVARKHDDITKENGPYIANGCMRTLRAIYNHARKTNRFLPRDNPADAVDWNEEKRRDTGMGASDLTEWFRELAALENPVRREFHLLTLLCGSRTTAGEAESRRLSPPNSTHRKAKGRQEASVRRPTLPRNDAVSHSGDTLR
ncbi:hypothetical protein [Bradyrhizobium sp. USDA 223]|uniref:hypothetical protein n=1 Tax=Bradyrhizobium sp. USDA 223 TaxID=3156306 RepID=UPI003834349F